MNTKNILEYFNVRKEINEDAEDISLIRNTISDCCFIAHHWKPTVMKSQLVARIMSDINVGLEKLKSYHEVLSPYSSCEVSFRKIDDNKIVITVNYQDGWGTDDVVYGCEIFFNQWQVVSVGAVEKIE